MNRALTLLAATTCAALALSSACLAAEWTTFPFQLAMTKDAGRVQFSIHHPQAGKRSSNWSQALALRELHGLSIAQVMAGTATPVRFALKRPAGRFACSGSVRSFEGSGTCTFAADAAFPTMLARRGVGRPSPEQSYKLAMSDFRPEVLDALVAAGYPRPTIEQSIAFGIFKIAPDYVRGLAAAGYRLGSIEELVGFKIHKVTPDFIASFARLGYSGLPADKLVQLRIFGVTPGDVRALQAQGIEAPSADQLVQRRLFGFTPSNRSGERR